MLVEVIDQDTALRWEIPSGHVNDGDSDILVTACREFREETGLCLNPRSLVPLTYARRRGSDRAGY